MGQSYLDEYGGWSSGDPFGHLIHYDLECCIAEVWFKKKGRAEVTLPFPSSDSLFDSFLKELLSPISCKSN